MRNIIRTSVLALFIAFPVFAAEKAPKKAVVKKDKPVVICSNRGTDLVFPMGNKLQVMKFNSDADLFEIQSFEFPGEGISYVTREELSESVEGSPATERLIARSPDDVVETVYTSKRDIKTLMDKERNARIGCAKKK